MRLWTAPSGQGAEAPAQNCGSWWLVTIALEPDVTPLVRASTDASLLPALRAVQEVTAAEESTVRASAEKWIAGVTAIFGLFGLTGVAVGKDSLSGIETWARALAGAAAGAALAAAAWAIFCTYRSAYGWPVEVDIGNDARLTAWYEKRRTNLKEAAGHLRMGVAWAGASLGLLFAAVGLIWFGPRTQPSGPLVLLTRTDDSQVCGAVLATAKDGEVRIRRPNGTVETVPTVQVRSVRSSKQCS